MFKAFSMKSDMESVKETFELDEAEVEIMERHGIIARKICLFNAGRYFMIMIYIF